jgi:hypothetical protein
MPFLLLPCLLLLASEQPPHPTGSGNPLDLSSLKAPLDRLAAAVDKAFSQAESLKSDALKALNWTAIGAAILLTILLMHTLHLHGLAASKSNLATETKDA